jgi:hypothetical protein
MRTMMTLVITGALAICVVGPASAAKVVTKYGSYEGAVAEVRVYISP